MVEGLSDPVDAERSAALEPSLNDAVGDENQPLARVELPGCGVKGRWCVANAERRMFGSFKFIYITVGIDHVGRWMAAAHPGQGPRWSPPARQPGRNAEVLVLQAADRLVDRLEPLLQILAAAPRGAKGAERCRAESGGCGPGAGCVGDRQPGAISVLDEVKPVTAYLIAREEHAGELRTCDPGDARRKEVLLDFGRRRGWLAPARGFDVVRVVVRQLQGSGPLFGDVGKRRDGRSHAEQQRCHPAAQPERLAHASR